MKIIGLESPAQVVILQGIATYAALASAYFFARPVLRGQTLQAHREILSELETDDEDIRKLVANAASSLNERSRREQPSVRRDNLIGIALLVFSFILLTCAVVIQVNTDPIFVPQGQNGSSQNLPGIVR